MLSFLVVPRSCSSFLYVSTRSFLVLRTSYFVLRTSYFVSRTSVQDTCQLVQVYNSHVTTIQVFNLFKTAILFQISGVTSIVKDVVKDVLTDSSKIIIKSNSFPLDPLKSQTLVIALQKEPTLKSYRIVRTSSDIGKSTIDHGRIGTPITNKTIWSEDDNFRVKIDVDKADKLDTIVQQSPTNEKNTASPQIEEESL